MEPAEIVILDSNPEGVIIEIVFRGGQWQDDDQIRKVIRNAVRTHDASAVLLNLSGFLYRGGDYAAGFLEAFFDKGARRSRPACFVGASREIANLFNTLDPKGVFNINYFSDRDEGRFYLKSRLEPRG
jgi:hypothetical protein